MKRTAESNMLAVLPIVIGLAACTTSATETSGDDIAPGDVLDERGEDPTPGPLPSGEDGKPIAPVVTAPAFARWDSGHAVVATAERVAIAYGGDSLRLAVRTGDNWTLSVVDDTPGAGTNTAAAVDSAGHLHIAYDLPTAGQVRYAYEAFDGTFRLLVADAESGKTSRMGVVAANDGSIRIAYGTALGPRVATCSPKGCSRETLDPTDTNWGASPADVALDPTGGVHMTYMSRGYLYHAVLDGSGWRRELLDSGATWPCLFLDREGHPHVLYAVENSGLGHAWNDGVLWQREMTHIYPAPWQPACGADGKGGAWVAYPRNAPGGEDGTTALLLDHFDPMTDSLTTVVTLEAGAMMHSASVTVEPSGSVHVAAYVEGELRWYRADGPKVERSTVHQALSLAQGIDLAMEANDVPHLALVQMLDRGQRIGDWSQLSLRHAWREGGTWHEEAVDPEAKSVEVVNVAVDSQRRVHLAYVESRYNPGGTPVFQYNLRHAVREGGTWSVSDTGLSSRVVHGRFLALDHDDHPMVAIVGSSEPDDWGLDMSQLDVALFDGTDWVRNRVANGPMGVTVSMAKGALGPWVTYIIQGSGDVINPRLYIGIPGVDGYHSEVVDPESLTSFYHALAMTADGTPHVLYLDEAGKRWRYAKRTSGSWTHEDVVWSLSDPARYCALALSEDGDPVAIVGESDTRSLRVARRIKGSWVVSTLASNLDVTGLSVAWSQTRAWVATTDRESGDAFLLQATP